MGHFKLSNKIKVQDITDDCIIPEADYTTMAPDGTLVQLKYIEEEDKKTMYDVKPGLYKIVKTQMGSYLESTSFAKDSILEEFVNTKNIEDIIDSFFNNIHLYAEFGIEIAKRNLLLYGVPGSGKTTAIAKCIGKYVSDNTTLVITWDTNVIEAYEAKSFINSFNYTNGVNKIIVIAEDIGGIENENVDMRTDSSLLSLLDNSDKTFRIPVMIIATTNHPANLASALANRPGRFDDKIAVDAPPADARQSLLKFFSKGAISEEALKLIGTKDYDKFAPAHIREIWVRSRLRSKDPVEVMKTIKKEVEEYKKAFEKQKASMGFRD